MNDCIIELTTWEEAPACWQNFTESCDLYNRGKEIHEGLKKYNATLTPRNSTGYRSMVFDTPADKTWFILRWS